jgi:hypothetical protein
VNAGRNYKMFSDPWIMGGAGVALAVIVIAAGVRFYNKLSSKFEEKAEAKAASKPSA